MMVQGTVGRAGCSDTQCLALPVDSLTLGSHPYWPAVPIVGETVPQETVEGTSWWSEVLLGLNPGPDPKVPHRAPKLGAGTHHLLHSLPGCGWLWMSHGLLAVPSLRADHSVHEAGAFAVCNRPHAAFWCLMLDAMGSYSCDSPKHDPRAPNAQRMVASRSLAQESEGCALVTLQQPCIAQRGQRSGSARHPFMCMD